MNKASIIAIMVIIAAGIGYSVFKPESSPEPQNNNGAMSNVEVPLYSTGTTQVGTALFTDEAGKTKVSVMMNEPQAVAQPTSLRAGTCETAGAIRYPLAEVVNGKSETVLTPAMHFIHGLGDTVITVQKSAQETAVTVACGNVRGAFDQANHTAN